MATAPETLVIYRGVLEHIVKGELRTLDLRVTRGQLSELTLADELLGACLRAGSRVVHLLGRDLVLELLLELCPPVAPTELESLVDDVSALLQGRRFDLGLEPLFGPDLDGALTRLFTDRSDLRLRAVAVTQAELEMDKPATAEPFCLELEEVLKTYEPPPSH